jgi:hypothetical protein
MTGEMSLLFFIESPDVQACKGRMERGERGKENGGRATIQA